VISGQAAGVCAAAFCCRAGIEVAPGRLDAGSFFYGVMTEAILYDGDSRPAALPAGASHRSAAHRADNASGY